MLGSPDSANIWTHTYHCTCGNAWTVKVENNKPSSVFDTPCCKRRLQWDGNYFCVGPAEPDAVNKWLESE